MPMDEREKRMELFAGFSQANSSGACGSHGAGERSGSFRRAKIFERRLQGFLVEALPGGVTSGDWGQTESPLLVHFGDSDFEAKYRTLLENIGQWRATAGRVESVDLRFSREAVVNPDTTLLAQHPHRQRFRKRRPASRQPRSTTAKNTRRTSRGSRADHKAREGNEERRN